MLEPCKIEDGNCFVRCLQAVYRALGADISAGDIMFGQRAVTPYYARPAAAPGGLGTLRFKYAAAILRGMRDSGPADIWLERHRDADELVDAALADAGAGVHSIALLNALHLPYTNEYGVRPGGLFHAPHTAIVVGARGGEVELCDPTIFPKSLEPGLEHVPRDDFARALADDDGIAGFIPFARLCMRRKPPDAPALDPAALRRSAVATFLRDHDRVLRSGDELQSVVAGAEAFGAYLADARAALEAGRPEQAGAALDRLFVLIFHFFRYTRRSLPALMRRSGVAGADAAAQGWEAAYEAWERLGNYLFLVARRPTVRRLDEAGAAALAAHALERPLVARAAPLYARAPHFPAPRAADVVDCEPSWSQFCTLP
jgi:hypothetical protein